MFVSLKNLFTSTRATKMVLVVRGDIKMSKGKTAAQCSHASILCYEAALKKNSNAIILRKWYESGQPKIVLKVSNSNELDRIYKQARDAGIISELVRDAGKTELSAGTLTVLGLGPDFSEKIDNIVKHLSLL